MPESWTYRELRDAGLSEGKIRWSTEAGVLRRPFHSVYLAGDDRDPLAALRALFRRLPREAVLTRASAARLHGFGDFVPTERCVRIALPAGLPRPEIRGVRVHESVLPLRPVMVDGIPCVPAARCAIELARGSPRPDALAVLDGALRAKACTEEELAREVRLHHGLRGVRQARELLPYADPGGQCRQESHLRLIIIDARLPRPETQIAVHDEDGWIRYFLDVGWRDRKVGVEYDGVSHADRGRVRRDRERHNWLAARGWRMRYFTDQDLYRRPRDLVAVVRQALT